MFNNYLIQQLINIQEQSINKLNLLMKCVKNLAKIIMID